MKKQNDSSTKQDQKNASVSSTEAIVRRDSEICEHCGEKLTETYLPPEDWGIHKFFLKVFSWRILFIKYEPEYSCVQCLANEQQIRESERFHDALAWAISEEIQKGNLILREQF